jgi:Helicase conserved C-terminal domain/Type III restriction enzyme, res subunit
MDTWRQCEQTGDALVDYEDDSGEPITLRLPWEHRGSALGWGRRPRARWRHPTTGAEAQGIILSEGAAGIIARDESGASHTLPHGSFELHEPPKLKRLQKASARRIWIDAHTRAGRPVAAHWREITGDGVYDAPERAGGPVRIIEHDGTNAIVQHEQGPRVHMPLDSVPNYIHDLNEQLPHAPTSGDKAIDGVLLGKGERVGKGNDGIVYRAPTGEAVKISTTVPYQPHNRGHRTPEGAVAHLRAEHQVHQALSDLPHIPHIRGQEHDGRYYLVKPWAPADERVTKDELDSASKTLEQMHARGWALNDTVQLGRDSDRRLWFQDLGQATRDATPAQQQADLYRLDDLYRANGHTRGKRGAELIAELDHLEFMLSMKLDHAQETGKISPRLGAEIAKWEDAHNRRGQELSEAEFAAWDNGEEAWKKASDAWSDHNEKGKALRERFPAELRKAADKHPPIPAGARWITARPNGPGTEGHPILIMPHPAGGFRVIGGAGGSMNHLRLKDVGSPEEMAERSKAKAKEKRASERERKGKLTKEEREAEKAEEKAKQDRIHQAERKVIETVREKHGGIDADLTEEDTAGLSAAAKKKVERNHHRKQLRQAMKARKDIAELLTSERMEQIEDEDAVSAVISEEPDLWTEAHEMGEKELALIDAEEESRRASRGPRDATHRADRAERDKASADTAERVISQIDRADAARELEELGGRSEMDGAMPRAIGETASEEQRRRAAENIDNALILADAAAGREPAADAPRAALEFEVIRDAIAAAGLDANAPEHDIRAALANEAAIQLQRAQLAKIKADKFEELERAGKAEKALKLQIHGDITRGLTAEVRDAASKLGLRENAKTPLRTAEVAELMDTLRSFEALRDAKKGLEACEKEVKKQPGYDGSRRAFDLSASEPPDHVVEGIEEQVLRELATRIVGMADSKSSAHAQAVADGHYAKIADISMAVSDANHIERATVDALGLKNAGILLRHALETEGHSADDLHDALTGHHVREQRKLTTEALRLAEAFVPHMEETIAETGDIEHAMTQLDAQEADIASAQRAIGSALGQMESTATLAQTMRGKMPEHLTIELKDKGQGTIASHLSWLSAIGLGPGEYEIDTEGKQIRIPKEHWGKLLNKEPIEVIEGRKLAHEIKRGDHDEDGWMPAGMVSRSSTSFTDPPKSAPRYHTGLDLSADDIHTALGDHIGSRLADGERPADILTDLLSQHIAGKSHNPEVFADIVKTYFPTRTKEDEQQIETNAQIQRDREALNQEYYGHRAAGRTEEMEAVAQKIAQMPKEKTVRKRRDIHFADHYEKMAADYLKRKHPNASALHGASLYDGADEASVREAVFRALSDSPEHVAAFTPIGELTPQHRDALQAHFYEKAGIGETKDWSGDYKENLDKLVSQIASGTKSAVDKYKANEAAGAVDMFAPKAAPKPKIDLSADTIGKLHPKEAKELAFQYPREGEALFRQAHGERPADPSEPSRLSPEVHRAIDAVRERRPHLDPNELAAAAAEHLGKERAQKELGYTEDELSARDEKGDLTENAAHKIGRMKLRTAALAEKGIKPEEVHRMYASKIWDGQNEAFAHLKEKLGTPWSQFVHFHGDLGTAYQALQAEMRGKFSAKMAEQYSKVTGKTLRTAIAEVPNSDLHAQAMSAPSARKELQEAMRKEIAENRGRAKKGERDETGKALGGTYSKDKARDEYKASKDEDKSVQQTQGGLFGASNASAPGRLVATEPTAKREAKPGERVSLGDRVEKEISALVGGNLGKNLDLKKKVRLFAGATMDGRRIHQQRVIKMLRKNGGRLGAWLGTGAGKTPTSIGAFTDLHATGDTSHGLFLVPNAVQSQFGEEMLSFTEPGKYRFETGSGKGYAERAAMLRDKNTHMRVMTHEGATKTIAKLVAQHHGDIAPEAMVEKLRGMSDGDRAKAVREALDAHGIPKHFTYVDEAHRLTTRQGEKESDMSIIIGALSHQENSTHALFGTGTPHKNDASEIHSMARLLHPDRYGDSYKFTQKYGHGSIAAPDAIRRELDGSTYTASIPPDGVSRLDIPNPERLEDGRKTQGAPVALSDEHAKSVGKVTSAYDRAKAAARNGSVDVEATKAVNPKAFEGKPEAEHQKIARDQASSLGIVKETAVRKALQLAPPEHNEKLRRMLDTVDSDVKAGKPSIVFSDSLEEANHVHKHLVAKGIASAVYHGGLSAKARDDFRANFDNGKHKVAVMTSAAEAGINIQTAKVIHHYDVPKTAKSWTQRNGRAYRQGQKDDVEVHDWQHAHEYDDSATQSLREKGRLADVFQTSLGALDEHGFSKDYIDTLSKNHEAFDIAAK